MYDRLIPELRDDPANVGYAGMSDPERLVAIHADTQVETYMRFATLRTCANILTDEEYDAFKAFLQVVAQQSARKADMVKMLETPSDDTGSTGGIDFSLPEVRQMIDMFGASGQQAAAVKLKGLAERLTSRAKIRGLTGVADGHMSSARKMMEAQ